AAAGDDIYSRLCRAIERPDLLTDPRFATAKARSTNRDVIMEVLMPVTRQKPSAEWIALLNEAGVPCGPIYKINESFADPQVQHLAMAQPVHSRPSATSRSWGSRSRSARAVFRSAATR